MEPGYSVAIVYWAYCDTDGGLVRCVGAPHHPRNFAEQPGARGMRKQRLNMGCRWAGHRVSLGEA